MDGKNQKILVLGTGNVQYDFIKLCKKFQFEVHSCSYKKEGSGIGKSDYFAEIDITDIPSITQYAETKEIDAIYTIGSDLALFSMVNVSEKLNLPTFVNSQTVLNCTHKSRFREKIRSHFKYSVIHQEINSETELYLWNCFPAILKPNDSQGQRGISEISNSNHLMEAYQKAIKYSQSGNAIIEEFISGFEISINLYVVEGEIKFRFITERFSFDDYPGGIVKSHSYPVKKMIDLEEVNRMMGVLITELDIKNGPVYMQAIITEEGLPKVIEVTPRMDGCHLWRMIYELHGINILEMLLNHLITGMIDGNVFNLKLKENGNEARIDFFTDKPNSKFMMKNHNLSADAVFTEWFYKDGEQVRTINGYQEKVGYQLIL